MAQREEAAVHIEFEKKKASVQREEATFRIEFEREEAAVRIEFEKKKASAQREEAAVRIEFEKKKASAHREEAAVHIESEKKKASAQREEAAVRIEFEKKKASSYKNHQSYLELQHEAEPLIKEKTQKAAVDDAREMAETEKAARIAAQKRAKARADNALEDNHIVRINRKASLKMMEILRKGSF